jgi:NADH-quinone oxidoreductase subunit N
MSLLYGLSGSLVLHEINAAFSGEPSLGLIMGIVFVVVGIAFKFGAVPFHMWVPDVYQGAPSSVTLFVATAPKIASFALAFRLLAEGLDNVAAVWTQMLAIVAVLSLLLGNIVALAQSNLKRLLAYSAIGNVGFILLGFVTASEQGYAAALFYTVAYVLTSLAAFGVLVLASQRGFEAEEFDHFKGLHARDPFLALMMMVAMFSVAGIPLFVGFWAKLEIFAALWAADQLALIVIAAVLSVVGVAYSLRVIKLMYFDPPGDFPAPVRHLGVRLALALNAAAIVLLGVLPNSLLQVCKDLLS